MGVNEDFEKEQKIFRIEDMIDHVIILIVKYSLLLAIVLFCIAILVFAAKSVFAEEYTCVVHKGEYVWIRETPESNGRKIGRCRFGYEVESDQVSGNFIKIETRPKWMLEGEFSSYGWVDRSYFEQSIPETMYWVNTEGGPLAKRETPDGRLICWIKPGVKISVLGWRYSKTGELWAKVFKGGYCKAEYLELR